MKDADVVLSDVHIYTDNFETDEGEVVRETLTDDWKNKLKVVHSRFVFRLPGSATNESKNKKISFDAVVSDEDGDLLVARNPTFDERVIDLVHFMATPLSHVGLQVWQGGMYLADFIIHCRSTLLSNSYVLELGSGTGLCSIVASMYAKHVICTDNGNAQLNLIKKNFEMNSHSLLYDESNSDPSFSVKELDWLSYDQFHKEGIFGWNEKDRNNLAKVNILLAADVIYHDKLTDAFFRTLLQLMSQGLPKTLYLSIERRINFSLEAMDVASPAYDYFQQCLLKLKSKLHSQMIETDLPQYFQYERNSKLELWKITGVS